MPSAIAEGSQAPLNKLVVPADQRFGERVRLGVLTEEISPGLVDEVVELTGCGERRRRLLPARAVVYFVLALCLFSSSDSAGPPGYRSVLRTLTEKLRHLPGLCVQRLPTSSALTRARQRLGDKPLQALFERRCGTLAASLTPGAFAFGLRLVAWDGTALDIPDTPANAAEFGFTGKGGVNQSGHPQVRLMALTECGTHALVDAAFDAVAKFSEHKLARRLLASLRPDTLLLADRNFAGYELWGLARATGAHLAWRIKQNLVFVPLQVLSDGSYLSIMRTPAENVRHGQARAAGRTLQQPPRGHLVRIIEYTVTIRPQAGLPRTETFRLVTSLLDPKLAPVRQLATAYHQRCEIENGFAELKNRLRGAGFILRSRAPELICQEIYALLTVYQALCALQTRAAEHGGTDPDRISFTITVQLARLAVAAQAAADATVLDSARHEVITELLAALLPTRRHRQCQRIKKPSKNTFEVRKRDQPRTPSNVHYTLRVTKHPT
ncbi:IS4 family transposase [Streptomyces sp. MUSC 125]|uniref:IS4 family transposase n=1 Tax=Streptomyces sp. MUSC 125 TaxID=1428624 RepID=UPI00068AA9D6|nr:IS4 family transposase [Streptomyces sp. MUSC 125]